MTVSLKEYADIAQFVYGRGNGDDFQGFGDDPVPNISSSWTDITGSRDTIRITWENTFDSVGGH